MSISFRYTHSVESSASPEAVWRLYSDVATWPRWDAAFERVDTKGPFVEGTEGIIKIHGQEPLPFRLTAVAPGRGFEDETTVPGGLIRFRHRLEPAGDGRLTITHEVEIEGPEPFGQQVGPMVTAGVPETMERLARLAEAPA